MLDEEDYADDPLNTGATTGEYIEDSATEALNALDRGPSAGEVADALDDIERAAEEIRKQQETAEEAVNRLQRGTHGSDGVVGLAEGADEAYTQLEEIRGSARSLVEGLVAASRPDESVSETTVLLDGKEYRVRFDPLEEADTGDPFDPDIDINDD